jgi:hypothetical protein
MTAQVPSPSPAPQRASNRATVNGNRPPRGAITCNGCHKWWTGLGLRTGAPAIRPSPASAPSRCTAPAHTPTGPGTASTRQRSTRRRPANPCSSPPTNHGWAGPGPAPGEDRRMTVSAETRADWQELQAYYAAAERNGTDHTHPPTPPTADVAFDVSAICAKSITLLMDDKRPASSLLTPTQTRPPNLSLRPAGSSIGRCRSGVSDGGLGHASAAALQGGDQGNRPARQSCAPTPA